jgi:hypothetical protein
LIQSRTTKKFWRVFSDLPVDIQQNARRAYRLFQSNPAHPSLQFKRLEREDDVYSARVGLGYRALAVMEIASFGIGSAVTPTTTVWSDNENFDEFSGSNTGEPQSRRPAAWAV